MDSGLVFIASDYSDHGAAKSGIAVRMRILEVG
jgi:hypothetical protein